MTVPAGGHAAAAPVPGRLPAAATGYWVSAESAVVRERPERASAAVGVAYRGDQLSYHDLDHVAGYTWWRVTVQRTGVTGWIRGDLLHTPEQDIATHLN
jgi:hypothetical protein